MKSYYLYNITFKTRIDLEASLGDEVQVFVAADNSEEALVKARAAMTRDYEKHLLSLKDIDYAELLAGMIMDGDGGMSEEEAKAQLEKCIPTPEKLREEVDTILSTARLISLEEMGKIVI